MQGATFTANWVEARTMYTYDVIVIGGGQRGSLAIRRIAIHAAPEAGAAGRPTWRGQDERA